LETSIFETMEAAESTPLPPWVFWTATPDLRLQSTPDYSGIPHLWTDAGVIIEGPPATFANCYKMVDEIGGVPAPWIQNMWYQTSGPDDPEIAVYAGSYANPGDEWPNLPLSAVFLVHVQDDPCVLDPYRAPFEEGPLEIIAERGSELLLRSLVSGRTIAFSVSEAEFRSALSTATPGPSPTTRVPALLPTDPTEYAVLAVEALTLGPQTEVRFGALGLGLQSSPNEGWLEVGVGSYLSPYSTLAADEISLGPNVSAAGLLVADHVSVKPTTSLLGSVVSPLSVEVDLPPFPSFAVPAAAPDATVRQGESMVLPPGDYSGVFVGPSARLELQDGTFQIKTLRVEESAVVECPGICELRVVESVYLGPSSRMTRGLGLDEPSELSVFVSGFRGLTATEGSSLDLFAYVPSGPIDLGPNGQYWGTFIAERFSLRRGSTVSGYPPGP